MVIKETTLNKRTTSEIYITEIVDLLLEGHEIKLTSVETRDILDCNIPATKNVGVIEYKDGDNNIKITLDVKDLIKLNRKLLCEVKQNRLRVT
jgi:hypothetical protein